MNEEHTDIGEYYYNLAIDELTKKTFLNTTEHFKYQTIIFNLKEAIKNGHIEAKIILDKKIPVSEVVRFKFVSLMKENQEFKKEKEKLIIENAELKKKNEELETHIRAMPDGELYFVAQKHYKENLLKGGFEGGVPPPQN